MRHPLKFFASRLFVRPRTAGDDQKPGHDGLEPPRPKRRLPLCAPYVAGFSPARIVPSQTLGRLAALKSAIRRGAYKKGGSATRTPDSNRSPFGFAKAAPLLRDVLLFFRRPLFKTLPPVFPLPPFQQGRGAGWDRLGAGWGQDGDVAYLYTRTQNAPPVFPLPPLSELRTQPQYPNSQPGPAAQPCYRPAAAQPSAPRRLQSSSAAHAHRAHHFASNPAQSSYNATKI